MECAQPIPTLYLKYIKMQAELTWGKLQQSYLAFILLVHHCTEQGKSGCLVYMPQSCTEVHFENEGSSRGTKLLLNRFTFNLVSIEDYLSDVYVHTICNHV